MEIRDPFASLYGGFEHGVPRVIATITGEDGTVAEVTEERLPAIFMGVRVSMPGGRKYRLGFGSGEGYREPARTLADDLAAGRGRVTTAGCLELDDPASQLWADAEMADDMLAVYPWE